MNLHSTIELLEALILIAGILTLGRLFMLAGDVKKTLENLEETRRDVSSTLKRIETIADTTEKVITEELVPTLRTARETLAHIEVASHAIADTTTAARNLAASLENAQKLFTLGGPIAQALFKKVGSGAGGFLTGITTGIRTVLARRSAASAAASAIADKNAAKAKQSKIEAEVAQKRVVRAGDESTNEVLRADAPAAGAAKATGPKR